MIEEKCATCKYCYKLKDWKNGEWETKSVCVLFPMIEKGSYDDYAMVVNKEYDMCEMWEGRK